MKNINPTAFAEFVAESMQRADEYTNWPRNEQAAFLFGIAYRRHLPLTYDIIHNALTKQDVFHAALLKECPEFQSLLAPNMTHFPSQYRLITVLALSFITAVYCPGAYAAVGLRELVRTLFSAFTRHEFPRTEGLLFTVAELTYLVLVARMFSTVCLPPLQAAGGERIHYALAPLCTLVYQRSKPYLVQVTQTVGNATRALYQFGEDLAQATYQFTEQAYDL